MFNGFESFREVERLKQYFYVSSYSKSYSFALVNWEEFSITLQYSIGPYIENIGAGSRTF